MTSPAAPNTSPRMGFHKLLDEAAVEIGEFRKTARHALAIGLLPEQIIDYVNGRLVPHELADMQSLLAKSPWGMSRVVALVKARRDPASLGARILATTGAVEPKVWGIPETGDSDADLARLLDQI